MISTRKTGAYISDLRKRHGMTQVELAEKLLVSPQAVSKWETGLTLPDSEQLLALSRMFGVTINEILVGGEAPFVDTQALGRPARQTVIWRSALSLCWRRIPLPGWHPSWRGRFSTRCSHSAT